MPDEIDGNAVIGEQSIDVTLLPQTGSRRDAVIRVVGPGDTDHEFPLSVTSTLLGMWGITDGQLELKLKELAQVIIRVHGTAAAFPTDGYWFDSYNSETPMSETLNKLRSVGETPFLKNRTIGGEIATIFGGNLLPVLEQIDTIFVAHAGMRLVTTLDYAFEISEANEDLSSPPTTKPEFLYRVCILSVIVDRFGIRLPAERSDTKSLKALRTWLEDKLDEQQAQQLTEVFARVKDLRKQYPLHEHFETDTAGQRRVRSEVREAETYFGFQDHHDYPTKWRLVVDKFQAGINSLGEMVGQL